MVSHLGWPIVGGVFPVVVPPALFSPSIELDDSRSKIESKHFETNRAGPVEESEHHVQANFTASLKSTNEEGNEDPESKEPGDGNDPSNGSVVVFLQVAMVISLNVGEHEEYEECNEF